MNQKTYRFKSTLLTRVIISLIISLAVLLRFYRVEENFYFSAEIGHNLLAIKNAYFSGSLPLLGPPTSHEWLYFGPLYYWLFGPILIFSKFNPVTHAYFGAFFSVLIVIAHYGVIKTIFSEKVALLSSFFITISPLYLLFTRHARFFFLVALFIYPFIYLLYRLAEGNKRCIFPLFFVYGCMFSFHFTPLMLLPFLISVLWFKKIRFSLQDSLLAVVGFVLPLLPFFVYDITHGLQMTKNVVLWIPYRIAGFFGLYPKNTVSTTVVKENTMSIIDFVTTSFIPNGHAILANVFFILLLCAFCLFIYSIIRAKKKNFSYVFVVLWFGWGLLAVFVHGSPPMHYFLPLFPVPIILFSLLLDLLYKRKGRMSIAIVCILFLCITMPYYFSKQWFFYELPAYNWSRYDVPFPLQQKIAKTIIKGSEGKQFVLYRKGINDQFEEDYAQNYQYLLWLYGNEPQLSGYYIFTINETGKNNKVISVNDQKMFRIENILVERKRNVDGAASKKDNGER